MPAGELLANEVAKLLHVQNGKTVNELTGELTGAVTVRAVRYAVKLLVADGRARLTGKKVAGLANRKRYKVLAAVPDGVALKTIEHPPGLIDEIAGAIRSGKLSLKDDL